jgi:hypothetical protein
MSNRPRFDQLLAGANFHALGMRLISAPRWLKGLIDTAAAEQVESEQREALWRDQLDRDDLGGPNRDRT